MPQRFSVSLPGEALQEAQQILWTVRVEASIASAQTTPLPPDRRRIRATLVADDMADPTSVIVAVPARLGGTPGEPFEAFVVTSCAQSRPCRVNFTFAVERVVGGLDGPVTVAWSIVASAGGQQPRDQAPPSTTPTIAAE